MVLFRLGLVIGSVLGVLVMALMFAASANPATREGRS